MVVPFSLLITHFIADFLLQSDWMALNKGRWNKSAEGFNALTFHCFIIWACFLWMGWKFALITFILHWITDALTSQLTSRLWFFTPVTRWKELDDVIGTPLWEFKGGSRHWFFVTIGFDQLLHYAGYVFVMWILGV